jgi:integrase
MDGSSTYDVSVWKLATAKSRRRKHGVRWRTAGKEHSDWFATKALAESFRTDLIRAQRAGERFDVASGLPASVLTRRNERSLLEVAESYVDHLWSAGAPPNTRRAAVMHMSAVVPLFVRGLDHGPSRAELQRLLSSRLLPPPHRQVALTPAEAATASWLRRASRPVGELADGHEAGDLLAALGRTANGRQVASSTWDTRRSILHRAVAFAVASGWLHANPITGRRLPLAGGAGMVDPRVVVNPAQARQLLAAVTYVTAPRRTDHRDRGRRLYAFFGCLYFGGLRPSEAHGLRVDDCVLPADRWGELRLARARPDLSGAHYRDAGDEEDRPLKHRRAEAVRVVPIPPVLVEVLTAHVAKYGTASDGRLFRGVNGGGGVPSSVYGDVWAAARRIGLSPEQEASPLARRPYDLRHAAVSTWLNAGVPPTEVAARAGHSVAVLLNVYAKCIDGERATYNARIADVLGG